MRISVPASSVLLSFLPIVVFALAACTPTLQPDLARLYETRIDDSGLEREALSDQPPVVLIHGAFGARLCDADGVEVWPAGVRGLVFSSYRELSLPVRPDQDKDSLLPCGITDRVAGRDFYGRIEDTLTGAGGYQLARVGQSLDLSRRHLYRFVYDWRQDNAVSARQLDAFVEAIRTDHGDEDLRVDIVAHSMGGLIARYWMRYGTQDVLDDNDFPVTNAGGRKVRKIVLVGTPSLGSTSALQQLLEGANLGVNKLNQEILLSFPSGYQLLPHPIVESIVGAKGQTLERDIFDIEIWKAFEWGPFDPRVRRELLSRGWSQDELAVLEEYVHKHLERARRFVWSLTVPLQERSYGLVVFGGDCTATPARILIEDIDGESYVRLWPKEVQKPIAGLAYDKLMLEPGDGAVTKASLLSRAVLDPSVPRHRYSDFPIDYPILFCERHSQLPGNLTFQDNLLHILLTR